MNKLLVILILIAMPVQLIGKCHFEEQNTKKQASGKSLKILTIGDSNGAMADGWVTQLKKIRPDDTILNISVSGNTIGYNNLGRSSLNTLANIGNYMEKAYEKLGRIDIIIIMLGTNDCKAVFKDSLSFVPGNMRKLITGIKNKAKLHKDKPAIFIVSPPPFGTDDMLTEKYTGGLERVKWLNEELPKVTAEEKVRYINSFRILLPVFRNLTTDGVHLNSDGQSIIAFIIEENIKYFNFK
jgi:lysophospholipase L1-like esterase